MITKHDIPNVYSLIGKTSIQEVLSIIKNSVLFVGLDSGLMHIAVSLNIPTFTIWGPSDFNLYGYEKINSDKHEIIYKNIYCRPCNSWIAPNTKRISKPEDCPDFRCMKELKPDEVFNRFNIFARLYISEV